MAELWYTPSEDIERIHHELREGFQSGKLKSIDYRKYQVLQLMYLIQDNAQALQNAILSDLGRPVLESKFMEISGTLVELNHTYSNTEKWAKTERAPFSLNFAHMHPVVRKEAKGVVCIISPFNYPIWLSIPPAASAISAGNTVVLKLSEQTPETCALLTDLLPKYIDPDVMRIVNGAVPETTKLLELQWDHILYTGSYRVAKFVAAAAAKYLTPVTLELGGKSPVIIDRNCDLELAARRILWGKCVNAGQTCVAPDYVLVPKDFQATFIKALKDTYAKFYPESTDAPNTFTRLVTPQAFTRVNNLLQNTRGTIVLGGETAEPTKFIAPTIVKDVPGDDSLMSEEIFGPVLPIVPVKDIDEAIAYVNAHDHPLALYVFSRDAKFKAKVFSSTQSGACIANEVVIHTGVEGIPFGGIGPSGSGYHTGKFGFDLFTHLRASIDPPAWIDSILGFRFPPYTAKKEKAIDTFITPKLPARPKGPPSRSQSTWWKWFLFSLALASISAIAKRFKDPLLKLTARTSR